MKNKGMSPIVAGVLMILLALAVSAIVASWLTEFSRDTSRTVVNQTEGRLDCVYANVFIDSFKLDCNNDCDAGEWHNFTMVIKNSGSVLLSFDKYYIINTSGNFINMSFNRTNVSAGGVINFTIPYNESCHGLNRTIDKVMINSLNCPDKGRDTLSGDDATFYRCG